MSEKKSSYGIGFPSALTLLFIGLKLGGVIDWSWWWVLAPCWLGFILFFIFGIIFFIIKMSEK